MRATEKWEKCVAFHGHSCGGLAVGYQASLYAIELLGIGGVAEDEEVVCITENDACGVDAVQALLGCTYGKGNLLVKLRGKQAFSFYNRKSGNSVRLVLRRTPEKSRDERQEWVMEGDYHELFDVKETVDTLPESARIFKTHTCAECGEPMSELHAHLCGDDILCDDCYPAYSRTL